MIVASLAIGPAALAQLATPSWQNTSVPTNALPGYNGPATSAQPIGAVPQNPSASSRVLQGYNSPRLTYSRSGRPAESAGAIQRIAGLQQPNDHRAADRRGPSESACVFFQRLARLQRPGDQLATHRRGASNPPAAAPAAGYFSGISLASATTKAKQTGDDEAEAEAESEVAELSKRIASLEQARREAANTYPIIRLGGFSQLDNVFYSQDLNSRRTYGDMQDGTGFRRTRLQAYGSLTEQTNYIIEMDFAAAGRPSFFDVWGEQTDLGILGTVRIGQFRQPTTMDALTSVRHLEFMERSNAFQSQDPFRRGHDVVQHVGEQADAMGGERVSHRLHVPQCDDGHRERRHLGRRPIRHVRRRQRRLVVRLPGHSLALLR